MFFQRAGGGGVDGQQFSPQQAWPRSPSDAVPASSNDMLKWNESSKFTRKMRSCEADANMAA
jgi:hypothetical protein